MALDFFRASPMRSQMLSPGSTSSLGLQTESPRLFSWVESALAKAWSDWA